MSPNADHHQPTPALSDHEREVLQRVARHLQSLVNNFAVLERQIEKASHLASSIGITNSYLTRDITAMSQYLDGMHQSRVIQGLQKDLVAVNYLLHYDEDDDDDDEDDEDSNCDAHAIRTDGAVEKSLRERRHQYHL